ncbi:MAG: hypothetical protein GF401_02625, partial [Chitinivibrionales bacterium]|nr:hypothetical protein [Chitinivibrionales bacterium]
MIRRSIVLLVTLRCLLFAEWYNTDWGYRIPLYLPVTTSTMSYMPIVVSENLHPSVYEYAKSDGSDIIFVTPSGYKLQAERVMYNKDSARCEFWINIPLYHNLGQTVYCYFGNPSHTETAANDAVWHSRSHRAVYHFENNAEDAAGFHHGVQQSAPQFTEGKFGGCYAFSASSHVEVPDNDSLSFGDGSSHTPFTLSAWINMNNAASFPIISKGMTSLDREYCLRLNSQKRILAALYDGGSPQPYRSRYSSATQETAEGEWSWVCAVHYGPTDSVLQKTEVYVNNTRVDDSNDSSGVFAAMENQASSVMIGRYIESAWAEGRIDEVRIIGKALEADERAFYFANQLSPGNWYSFGALERPPATFGCPYLINESFFWIFICIGQSNMAGRGPIEAEDTILNSRILLLDDERNWETASNPLNKYATMYDNNVGTGPYIGPAWSFANYLSERNTSVKIGLILNAKGGSHSSEWQRGTPYYDSTIVRALAAMECGIIKGVIWHQGEADAFAGTENQHLENIRAMVSDLRADLGIPDLPFIAGQVYQTPVFDEINSTIATFGDSIPKAAFVSSGNLTAIDGVHFGSPSQRLFGERYAIKYIEYEQGLLPP